MSITPDDESVRPEPVERHLGWRNASTSSARTVFHINTSNNITQKIYVTGHRGMVGSAIVRTLQQHGQPTEHLLTRTHAELDLTDQAAVRAFFATEKPDQVYLAARPNLTAPRAN